MVMSPRHSHIRSNPRRLYSPSYFRAYWYVVFVTHHRAIHFFDHDLSSPTVCEMALVTHTSILDPHHRRCRSIRDHRDQLRVHRFFSRVDLVRRQCRSRHVHKASTEIVRVWTLVVTYVHEYRVHADLAAVRTPSSSSSSFHHPDTLFISVYAQYIAMRCSKKRRMCSIACTLCTTRKVAATTQPSPPKCSCSPSGLSYSPTHCITSRTCPLYTSSRVYRRCDTK